MLFDSRTCVGHGIVTVVVRLVKIENLSSKSTGGAVYTQCTSAAREQSATDR